MSEVMGIENRSTKAGNFNDTVVVKTTFTDLSNTVLKTEYWWLAKGIGPVHITSSYLSNTGSPESDTEELVYAKVSGTQYGSLHSPLPAIHQTTIQTGQSFNFSTGQIGPAGNGDFTYACAGSTCWTRSTAPAQTSLNVDSSEGYFTAYLETQLREPVDNQYWYNFNYVFGSSDGGDCRGKCTRWYKTKDGKCACVSFVAGDQNSLTFKWVYPYGNYMW